MKFAIISILLVILTSSSLTKRRAHHHHTGKPKVSTSSSSETKVTTSSSSSSFSSKTQSTSSSSFDAVENALNVDVDNNGKPWTQEGVKGYEECSYRGTAEQIWKENAPNWYRFTVFGGEVKEVGKTSVSMPVKSFRVPKGFKLEYKGMFLKNKYETPLTTVQKERIADIPEMSFAKHVTSFTDEVCAINMDFWYMNLQVTAMEYVKIARRIPTYLSLCIENQKLYIQKSELEVKIRTKETENQQNTKTLLELEKLLIDYNKVLEEMRNLLQSLTAQVSIITKILTKEITIEHWIKEVKSYSEEITALEVQIKQNQEKIKLIRIKINNFESEIQTVTQENTELTKKISNTKADIETIETKTTKTTTEITTIETTISKLNDDASKYSGENTNLKAKLESIKEQITKLQKEASEIEIAIKTNKENYDKVVKELTVVTEKKETIIKTKEETTVTITTKRNSIDSWERKYRENVETIEDRRKQINSLEKEIADLEVEIKRLDSQIKEKTSYATKQSTEYYRKEKIRIETEISEIKITIETKTNEVIQKTETRNKLKLQIDGSTTPGQGPADDRKSLDIVSQDITKQFAKIKAEFTAITNIFSEQSEQLRSVMTSFSSEKVEYWAVKAKTSIKKYLYLVPSNSEPIFDMMRRRRRFRRMRRRFY